MTPPLDDPTAVERAFESRSADVYAGFLLPHLRPHTVVLDCGCGEGTIAIGLSEAVPHGRVIGVDIGLDNLAAARRYAAATGRANLAWAVADGQRLPFHDGAFEAVLCHSVLETLEDPAKVVAELRRVTKRGGVVGVASVEYGGLILGGERTEGPRRRSRRFMGAIAPPALGLPNSAAPLVTGSKATPPNRPSRAMSASRSLRSTNNCRISAAARGSAR